MLQNIISNIHPLDEVTMEAVEHRVNHLAKPQGSLGKLEEMVVQVAGITGQKFPMTDKKALIVMCCDHGICDEGVASGLQSVTYKQAKHIPRGFTGAGAIAKQMNAKIYSVDVGIMTDVDDEYIIDKKVMYGTNNMAKGPAMTRDQAIKGIEAGIEMAIQAVDEGANILATGEMGIGNTSPTTAILSIYTGCHPSEITGIGGNLPVEKLSHKARIIQQAIEINKPDKNDPLDVLSKVGGLDIAGMTGIMLGAAYKRVPVVIDGFISTISAILACELCPKVRSYLMPSHYSLEKGAKLATDYLGLSPYLDMDMRLGEGTGALLAFNIIEAACYMNREMITFEEATINVV